MKQLLTKWGKAFSKDSILNEYPRPIKKRKSYLSLNGEWDFEVSTDRYTDIYSKKINVPFAPETYLSGVGYITQPDDYLHYRKVFHLPKNFNQGRVFLNIGAIDQECEIYLNEMKIGEMQGGYLPHSFEVTDRILVGENTLQIRVTDQTEFSPHARGKQKLYPKGDYSSLFYTPVSGIWKSVWLESTPLKYIEDIKTTPDLDKQGISLVVRSNVLEKEEATIRIFYEQRLIQEEIIATNQETFISLKEIHEWSPETPHLYDLQIIYDKDLIASYFGMRKFSVEKDVNGILRFYLNNEPYYFNGVLDQGYWPESLLTPPSDEALIDDIQQMKKLGFNTLRKHVKIEVERFYYHCDRLGMIVWQDMPNGGGDYNHEFVTDLPNESDILARNIPDDKYTMFKRESKEGRDQYYKDLKGMITSLYNYPSIAMWVPFNEGWGQFDANQATKLIRQLDHTRYIMETSGWFDQGGGDVYSIHNYRHQLKVSPKEERVVVLSEFGGYARSIDKHQSHEKKFGYRYYETETDLTKHYERLWRNQILPNINVGLSASIYTQLSDIEEEANGLLTYDREILKMNGQVIQSINQDLQKHFYHVTKNK